MGLFAGPSERREFLLYDICRDQQRHCRVVMQAQLVEPRIEEGICTLSPILALSCNFFEHPIDTNTWQRGTEQGMARGWHGSSKSTIIVLSTPTDTVATPNVSDAGHRRLKRTRRDEILPPRTARAGFARHSRPHILPQDVRCPQFLRCRRHTQSTLRS